MTTRRSVLLTLVVMVIVGGISTGVGAAQQGRPLEDAGSQGDGGPPDNNGPITEPSLVVTNVTVHEQTKSIRVTVANPGKRPVSVSTVELEAVQNQTVVENVFISKRNVTADLVVSSTEVVGPDDTVEVLKDINFRENSAITDVFFESEQHRGLETVEHEPAGVVTSIQPATEVVQNISELHTRPGDQDARGDIGEVVRKSIEYVRDPTAVVGDALEGIIVGDQIAPVFAVLVEKTDVVGPGDWENGTVVGSITPKPHAFVDFVQFAVTDRKPFLQKPKRETGVDPPEFKQRVEVVKGSSLKQVVDKISWNTPAVVQNATALKRRVSETRTSVWDAPAMNGSTSIDVRQRERVTLGLSVADMSAKRSGMPPDLEDAEILDGWLYDANGQELVHFLVRPGS